MSLTLRKKQGLRVGTYISDTYGNHDVVVRPQPKQPYNGQAYTVEVDSKPVTTIYRRGNGRNLSWHIDNAGVYGGTLERAAERAVSSHLYSLQYAAEENTKVASITSLLPYGFDNEREAVDFAFGGGLGEPSVVARYHSRWYVGFPQPATTPEAVVTALKDIDGVNANDIRVYGSIDPRVVIEALKEQGVSAHFSMDRTEVQIYGVTGNLALHIAKDGEVTAHTPREEIVGAAKNEERAVRSAVRWYKSYDLQVRANDLLKHLETQVPSGVAHYAVEQAKTALRTLAREAHTVDFTYERKGAVL